MRVKMVAPLFFVNVVSAVLLTAAACGTTDDTSPSGTSAPRTVNDTPPAGQRPVSPPSGQQKVDSLPQAPPAAAGINGLLNAPSDPATGDVAEADFDRWAFHQVVNFWLPLMNSVGLESGTQPNVTFQPV